VTDVNTDARVSRRRAAAWEEMYHRRDTDALDAEAKLELVEEIAGHFGCACDPPLGYEEVESVEGLCCVCRIMRVLHR